LPSIGRGITLRLVDLHHAPISSDLASAVSAGRVTLVVRASDLGTISVAGADRQTWLNGLVTSDLSRLAPGRASYGLFLVKIGRILADAWIVQAGERLLVGLSRARVDLVREHLEKYLMMEDATHADASDEFAWLMAHGPQAADLAATVASRLGGFAGAAEVTGLGDAVLAVPTASVEAALDAMVRGGARLGSEDDRETLRIARGVPRFGRDFGDKTYPQEASLEKIAVSFQKGCYLGQEVVCRLEMRGHVIKKIVALRLDGPELPPVGAEVQSKDGKTVGTVTSAIARAGDVIALAMLRVDFTEPGFEVSVQGSPATVLDTDAVRTAGSEGRAPVAAAAR
jgi:folate-binding protein YgfZ